MKNLDEDLKRIIYWVGLGVALILYANANFAAKGDVIELRKISRELADKDDVRDLKNQIIALSSRVDAMLARGSR